MGKKHKSQKKYQPAIPVSASPEWKRITDQINANQPEFEIPELVTAKAAPTPYASLSDLLVPSDYANTVYDTYRRMAAQVGWVEPTPEEIAARKVLEAKWAAEREAREAERERVRQAQIALNMVVDARLEVAPEPFRSIAELHSRWSAESGCDSCENWGDDAVRIEKRCKTVALIVDYLIRNEAIVAHREALSVLEVGAL